MASLGLAYWRDAVGGPDLADNIAYAQMMGHPRFAEACRLTAMSVLTRNIADPNVMKLMKDGRRTSYGVFTLYLDMLGGLTLTTIQKFCEDTGLASPGRAAAIMVQLWMTGYLTRNTDEKDRRVQRYKPTPGLEGAIRDLFRDELRALALLEPDAQEVADRLDDPMVFGAYLMGVGKGLEKMLRRTYTTEMVMFAERNAALGILYHLATSSADDVYPPRKPVPLNIADLARRFGVSRSHVHRLLRDGEKKNLFRRNDDDTVTFTELLRTEIDRFHAGLYMGSAACALEALEAAVALQSAA